MNWISQFDIFAFLNLYSYSILHIDACLNQCKNNKLGDKLENKWNYDVNITSANANWWSKRQQDS